VLRALVALRIEGRLRIAGKHATTRHPYLAEVGSDGLARDVERPVRGRDDDNEDRHVERDQGKAVDAQARFGQPTPAANTFDHCWA
jgi:hypothetical protein